MNVEINNFNIRVYGILLHEGNVLVTDENRGGRLMTKFPGGGLEKGEGIADCLKREFMEEIGIEISLDAIFYVNEFFQRSRFDSRDQLISFYYIVHTDALDQIPIIQETTELKRDEQHFYWVALHDLKSENFTFPIDRVVVDKLKK